MAANELAFAIHDAARQPGRDRRVHPQAFFEDCVEVFELSDGVERYLLFVCVRCADFFVELL